MKVAGLSGYQVTRLGVGGAFVTCGRPIQLGNLTSRRLDKPTTR
jgi:hypothetical protein